jgi:thiamine biosynthesis protein ThiS
MCAGLSANPTETTRTITLNGEVRAVAAGSTVASLLAELGLRDRQVAVERNKQIVRRPDRATTELLDGDQLELVTFFGGG